MSDGFDFEEDDDHLLERIDNHEEFIRKQEHIEAIKDAVWKWRYWMIAAGVALLVLSIAALAFAVSRGSSGEPSPLFTSQERDQAFFSASEGTQQALRADAVYITRKPHLAGTIDELELSRWIATQFELYGLPQVQVQPYSVLLPFPGSSRVEITEPAQRRWVAVNQESGFAEDPTSDPSINVPVFSGYSPSGTAEAPVVYCNYGREEDFLFLDRAGVNISGTIVLVRYGRIFRANKCLMAQQRGAVGCLVYSDPTDDGFLKGKAYPEGPWRPKTGVQRGTMYVGNGDPMTPGWPAVDSAPRITLQQAGTDEHTDGQPLPKIPIHPLAWGDAQPILAGLDGGPELPASWQGGVPDVVYRTGPSDLVVRMGIVSNITRATVNQVLGIIPGAVEPDRWVILGAHRDAWDLGAMDPGSGTITILNVARALGALLKQGWRPRRTIVVMSHDAEEQGLVGSAEWVEHHKTLLQHRGVAYLNVDIAVDGREQFSPSGTPSLQALIRKVARLVPAPPDQRAAGKATVSDMWPESQAVMGSLGSGSDFTAFQQHAGLAAADFEFTGNSGYGGVYHSAYDSFYWLSHFGDPDFEYHKAMTQVMGLVALHLADEPLLELDYVQYPLALMQNLQQVQRTLASVDGLHPQFDFSPMQEAIALFNQSAVALRAALLQNPSPSPLALRGINDQLVFTERTFINFPKSARGWYAHSLFSPGKYDAYATDAFPVLGDAIHDHDWDAVAFQIQMLATIIRIAADSLSSSPIP